LRSAVFSSQYSRDLDEIPPAAQSRGATQVVTCGWATGTELRRYSPADAETRACSLRTCGVRHDVVHGPVVIGAGLCRYAWKAGLGNLSTADVDGNVVVLARVAPAAPEDHVSCAQLRERDVGQVRVL